MRGVDYEDVTCVLLLIPALSSPAPSYSMSQLSAALPSVQMFLPFCLLFVVSAFLSLVVLAVLCMC